MKLLIITDAWYPQVNGVVRTYENLSEGLRNLGHEVKIIGPSEFPLRLPMLGYSEIQLAIAPYRRLVKMIEDYAPDKIHLSTEGPLGWAGRRYCVKNNRPYSSSFHTQFPDYVAKRLAKFTPALYPFFHNMAKKIVRTFHARSSAMMVATQSLEDQLRSWEFKNPMHRLTRGAHLNQFYPGEKTEYHDLKGPIALYVGRVAIEKNIKDFLNMDWHGSKVVVGDGPSKAELEKKHPETVFAGTREGEELAAYYRSADIFVFPSRTDTFGIVLIEALACGLPIAAYNVTGPKDIVTEDFLGALSEDNLAEAAQKALKHGKPEKCSEHVKTFYTWENVAKQFENALINKVK